MSSLHQVEVNWLNPVLCFVDDLLGQLCEKYRRRRTDSPVKSFTGTEAEAGNFSLRDTLLTEGFRRRDSKKEGSGRFRSPLFYQNRSDTLLTRMSISS